MTLYMAIYSGEHRQYWRQDQMGYTDQPNELGWWPVAEAEELIADIGQDKMLELVPHQPTMLQIMQRKG